MKWRVKDLVSNSIIRAAPCHSKSFRVITPGSDSRQMIFNLQEMPHLPSSVPVRSPCRRSPWSRSCPGVAGGWDPASSRPSSLSPYLPLASSPTLGLNRTSLSLGESLDSPLRLSALLSHPPSRADPLVFVFDTSSSLLYGRGILKRVGPCTRNPPGLQPERIGPWEIATPRRRLHLPFRARGRERLRSRLRDAKNSSWKSRRTHVALVSQRQSWISTAQPLPLRKKDDRARRTRREVMIFISTLIPIISRRRISPG